MSTQEMQGPWYWVYFRPRWELMALPARSQEDSFDHPRFWRAFIAPKLASTYNIASRRLAALNETPYGMPRGRVSRSVGRIPNWNLCHGNDLPKVMPIAKAFCAVATSFNLTAAVTTGTVRQLFDEHEQMLPDDMIALQEILGPIPYAAHGFSCFAVGEAKAFPKSNSRRMATQ